jgi:hypothetical protein
LSDEPKIPERGTMMRHMSDDNLAKKEIMAKKNGFTGR